MYIRTEELDGLSQAPPAPALGPVAVIELGAAVLSLGRDLFTGGSFQTQSSVVNYIHQGTPLSQKFVSCKRRFKLSAAKPGGPFPIEVIKKYDIGEKFWFELSYEYNGNDLRNVAVEPLVNKSSSLNKSEFKIAFVGNSYSPEQAQVAEVVFRISGTWKAWDPVPFMDTLVSFSGNLYVRADGSARIDAFKSEKDLVWYNDITNSCAVATPYVPPPPKVAVRKFFSLAVLFPFDKHNVSAGDAQRIHDWVGTWPSATQAKVARGEITITIEGFASKPGKPLYNIDLSSRRAESVKNILQKFAGSNTRFDLRSQGAMSQNLPGMFDVIGWMTRMMNPNKQDQAAVIRFEDTE
jgi:outer membrane protein OmpA-like peptidoglycan-associated protein